MENLSNEPLDMHLRREQPAPIAIETEGETSATSADGGHNGQQTYLPQNTNYYLYEGARLAQIAFWVLAAGLAGLAVNTLSLFAGLMDAPGGAGLIVLAVALFMFGLIGACLFFMFRFSREMKAGIEADDAQRIDAGAKALYHWMVCTLICAAFWGLSVVYSAIQSSLSFKGNIAVVLFGLLGAFLVYYFWRENRALEESPEQE